MLIHSLASCLTENFDMVFDILQQPRNFGQKYPTQRNAAIPAGPFLINSVFLATPVVG